MPATASGEGPAGTIEFFGHVSYTQPPDGDPTDFRASADFTDVLADDNPEWRIDLNDDVIGRWRGESGMSGEVTLVWGRPLLRGAVAATAELAGRNVDQDPVSSGRFTLIALDALEGYGDDVFLEVEALRASGRASQPRRASTRRARRRLPDPQAKDKFLRA